MLHEATARSRGAGRRLLVRRRGGAGRLPLHLAPPHPVAIEERASHLLVCRAWPGPLCGSCWAASCECGYAFDAVADAHSRWPNGRLRCHSCAS